VVERQRLEADSSSRRVDFSRLPSGFVTHLFTDIEGSTELLTELTDRYAAVLDRVRKAIRQEVRSHGG
jgi:class 3 adenylate cyclase